MVLAVTCIKPGHAASAGDCENPWGKALPDKGAGSETITPGDVQLCLPMGFVPENREAGVAFSDPKDAEGKRGRLGLAISLDRKYQESDKDEEYERIKIWLCNLANTSVGTSCSIVRLKGVLFVLLHGLEVGTHTESYFHMGNGYLLALSAEAPDEDTLAVLRAVIREVKLPRP